MTDTDMEAIGAGCLPLPDEPKRPRSYNDVLDALTSCTDAIANAVNEGVDIGGLGDYQEELIQEMNSYSRCPDCEGDCCCRNNLNDPGPCQTCDGSGMVP